MKFIKLLTAFVSLLPLTLSATPVAQKLKAENIGNWNFFVDSAHLGHEFTANSIATLQLPAADGGISVNIRELEQPVPDSLVDSDSISAWHKFVFSGKAEYKISTTEEAVRHHNGQLQYMIVFHNENGTQLNTAELVTVIGGRAYALIYEMPIPLFNADYKKVKPLFENIRLRIADQ